MGILDISLPEPSNLLEGAKKHGNTVGILAGAAGAGVGASAVAGSPLAAVVMPLVAQSYLQAATDDIFGKTQQSLQQAGQSRSGSMVHVCDGICKLIDPFVDDDANLDHNQSLNQAAREDPEKVQQALEQLLTDETKRDELQQVEQTLAAVFAGEKPPDEAPIERNDPESIIKALKDIFDAEDDREALYLYTLYSEFLGDVTDEVKSEGSEDQELREALEDVDQRLDHVEQWTAEVVDTLTLLTLKNQAFTQVTALDFERQDPFRSKPPRYLWITGYNFAELSARHGSRNEPYYFDRGLPPSHQIAASADDPPDTFNEALIDELNSGSNVVLTGPPASGKSHICKHVAAEWYSEGLGDVFYRESAAERPFEQDAELERAIENADTEGPAKTLVVVEDAVADHASRIFEVMDKFRRRGDTDVCFLLDSRQTQWNEYAADKQPQSDPPTFVKMAHEEDGTDFLNVIETPSLSKQDCRKAIEIFNRTTNGYFGPPKKKIDQLYDAVVDDQSSRGQMLILSDELLTNSRYGGTTGEFAGDAPVRQSAGDLHSQWLNALDHDAAEQSLGYQVAIAVATLTAADIEISLSHLYALASNRRGIKSIADILEGSADLPVDIRETLLIPDEAAASGFTTRHTQWASEFLASQLDGGPGAVDTVHETFVQTVSKMAYLADDSQLRSDISRWLTRNGREDSFLQRLKEDQQQPIERLLEAVVSIGRQQDGHLARLLQDTFLAGGLTDQENLPDVCTPVFRFELEIQRGWILRQVTTPGTIQDDPEQLFGSIITDSAAALTPPEQDWIRARATAAQAEIAKDRLRYTDAIDRFETAIEHYESIDRIYQAATTYRRLANLGRTTEELQWDSVREYYDRAIELFQAESEHHDVLRTATTRATTAINFDSITWEEILTHQHRALDLFETSQPDPEYAYWYRRTLREQSKVARESSELHWDAVKTRYERAIESYTEADQNVVVARLKEELATAAAERAESEWDTIQTLYKESADIYRSRNLDKQISRVYHSLAKVNYDLNTADWETTETYYSQALAYVRTAGATDTVIEVLREKANTASQVETIPWSTVEIYYEDLIAVCQSNNAPTDAAKSARAFAEAATTNASDFQTIDDRYQDAIDRFRALGHDTEAARLTKRRSEVAAERTDVDWEAVERIYQTAIDRATHLGMEFEAARIKRSLAREAKRQDLEWTVIEEYFEQAAAAFEATDMQSKAAMTYRWLASAAVRNSKVDWETAQRHFEESTNRFRTTDESFEIAGNHCHIADAALETGAKPWADLKDHYKQAIDIYETTGHQDRIAETYHTLGNAACEANGGSIEEAIKNYQAARQQLHELSRDTTRQQIRLALDATEMFIEINAKAHSVRWFERAVEDWCETWVTTSSREDSSELRELGDRIAGLLPTVCEQADATGEDGSKTLWCDQLMNTISMNSNTHLYMTIATVCKSRRQK